jgi:hypothetical protein
MRIAVLGFVLLFALGDGCSSGVVGVQDYGNVAGRVLDATTNKPIANALVSVGSLFTANANVQGAFNIPHIPIGNQTVTARSPGFTTDSADIEVLKNKTAQIGYLRLVPVTKPYSQPTLPPPATPTPVPSVVPTWAPTPTPGPPGAASPTPGAATPVPGASVPAPASSTTPAPISSTTPAPAST